MNSITTTELRDLAKEARAVADAAAKIASRIASLLEATADKADAQPLKFPNGKLTEAGVAAVNAAFDRGATVMEVARQFEITPSGASYRHTVWMSGKGIQPTKADPTDD